MTDTTKIRIARALMKLRSGVDDFEALDAETQTTLLAEAAVALEAAREPTQAMIEAGVEIIQNVHAGETGTAFASDAANTWRFMIDIAASE